MKIRQLLWLLPLFAVMGYIACRKMDSQHINEQPQQTAKENRFFNEHTSTDPQVQAIANYVKGQNEKFHFVENLVKQIGYPRWDKAMIVEKKVNLFLEDDASGGEVTYIPFVRDSQNYVNASLIVRTTATDTTSRFVTNGEYIEAPRGLPGEDSTAESMVMLFMALDKNVFSYRGYRITDSTLFNTVLPWESGKQRDIFMSSGTTQNVLNELFTQSYLVTVYSYHCGTPTWCNANGYCDYLTCTGMAPTNCYQTGSVTFEYTITFIGSGDGGGTGGGIPTPIGGSNPWNPGPVGGGGSGPIGFVPLEDPPTPELPPCDKVAPLKNDEYFKGYINNNLKPSLTGVQEYALWYKEDISWPTGIVVGEPGKCEVKTYINNQTNNLRNFTHTHYNICEYPLFSPHDFKEIGDFYNLNKYLFAQSNLLEPYFTYGLVTNAGYYVMVIDDPALLEAFLDEYFADDASDDERKLTIEYNAYNISRANDAATNEKRFLQFIKKKELGIKVLKANSDLSSYNLLSLSVTGELISTPCQ